MATPLHAADDSVTTPTTSPSTYYSEDDWTDSPRQGNDHLQSSGYPRTTNETVSFARGHLHPKPSALTTVEIHNEKHNGEHSSSIMTPVKDGAEPRRAIDPYEQEDTTMVDSWSEAELVVPDSPAVHVLSTESDPNVSLLTTTVGPTASSSYKETIPATTPPLVRPVAVKPPKGKTGSGRKKRRSHQSQVDLSDSSASDVIPPASVATAPALKPWNIIRKGQNVSNHFTTMPTILNSHDNLVSMATSTLHSEHVLSRHEESGSAVTTSETSVLCIEQRLLPVSSSPVDIVVMLSRMASFCASLTVVLAPKLPVNTGISAGECLCMCTGVCNIIHLVIQIVASWAMSYLQRSHHHVACPLSYARGLMLS